jgi:hypothetical protein
VDDRGRRGQENRGEDESSVGGLVNGPTGRGTGAGGRSTLVCEVRGGRRAGSDYRIETAAGSTVVENAVVDAYSAAAS